MATVEVVLKITDRGGKNITEEFQNARGKIYKNNLVIHPDGGGSHIASFQSDAYLYWRFIENIEHQANNKNIVVILKITNNIGEIDTVKFENELADMDINDVLQIYHFIDVQKVTEYDSGSERMIVAEFQPDSYLYWKYVE